MNVAEFNKQ